MIRSNIVGRSSIAYSGTSGNDLMPGSVEADSMAGGQGNDTYVVNHAGDTVLENAGEGYDQVQAWIDFTLPANIEVLRLFGTAYRGTGSAGAETLYGNDGANLLEGMGGNDQLVGGGGDDILRGGTGDDHYYVYALDDLVEELAGEGDFDWVDTVTETYVLPANVERLSGVRGPSGQHLTGNALNNTITSGNNNDYIDGGAGYDWMNGGGGNDVYVVDHPFDTAAENENAGVDEVRTALSSYELGSNVENLTGTAATAQLLSGNAHANAITGGTGDDTLRGLDGDDVLSGAAGADRMEGGAGDDRYIVDSFTDTVVETEGGGSDRVQTGLGSKTDHSQLYVLPAFVEKLTGTSAAGQGVRGNALSNDIEMGAGDDLVVLDDGGDDRVSGGSGHDFFYFGATFDTADAVDGGAGSDTLGLLGVYDLVLENGDLVGVERIALYSAATVPGTAAAGYRITTSDGTVAAGLRLTVAATGLNPEESLFFDGSAESDGRFTVSGGGGGDTVHGGAKGDHLEGAGGDDHLSGGGGHDTLVGGAGRDLLRGGTGNDFFRYEAGTESSPNAPDEILDFAAGDKIDLSAIDPRPDVPSDQRFAFIGSAAFAGAAGQVRAWEQDGLWRIEADVDGDGAADLTIYVTRTDPQPFTAADFLL